MVPSYLDSYPRDYFLKARSNGLSIQTAARKEKRTFATLICWTISYLEITTKEENMLLYMFNFLADLGQLLWVDKKMIKEVQK